MTDHSHSDDFHNQSFKSFFARSMVVNSENKQTKSEIVVENGKKESANTCWPGGPKGEETRLRRNTRSTTDDTRRYSCSNLYSSLRKTSTSSRISEIPIENMVNQSKLETLEWQLKEIQKSREMYRAVMKQVVTYLEKAHHSLELLTSRINRRNSLHKSRSEHSTLTPGNQSPNLTLEDHKLKDLQWRQSKPEEPSPEEIPPDKLAQEAFRLLRTVQSLLNTREPDLVQVPTNDVEFLEQLAKEFPNPENKPQRTTSFSMSPKLIMPDSDTKISQAFNRKLSLQLSDVRRTCHSIRTSDSSRGSVAESDTEMGTDIGLFSTGSKAKSDKSSSPANGSISSVEDESGFSSMNSFQEIGLPIINSTMTEEVTTKNALLRSMLHNNFLSLPLGQESQPESLNGSSKEDQKTIESMILWQKPEKITSLSPAVVTMPKTPPSSPHHKRWSSTPVKEPENHNFKVLWV